MFADKLVLSALETKVQIISVYCNARSPTSKIAHWMEQWLFTTKVPLGQH